MNEPKQINFTILPADDQTQPRVYSNFCAISHTPFDVMLSFCEVQPLSEDDVRHAGAEHIVRAPVRAKIVLPIQVVPGLINALQEHMRTFSEAADSTWPRGPVH